MPYVPTYLRALHAYIPLNFTRLRPLRAYVPSCHNTLIYVPTCPLVFRAYVP